MLHIFRRIRNGLKVQGLPKLNCQNGAKVRVKHSGDILEVINAHYNPELGSYVYWLRAGSLKLPVSEKYLENNS